MKLGYLSAILPEYRFEQVVDYVVENGYVNNVLDLMKAPFDRPYKFSVIFTREEQLEFVKIINQIKDNAVIA